MNEEHLFNLALDVPLGERTTFLEKACGDDTDLRHRVEELLNAHDNPGGFLARPALSPTPLKDGAVISNGTETSIIEKPGTNIGPYQLVQMIGEGGMGTVFLAEQSRPVQRQVALKIIKPGMDSRQVVARFEAERQALAMMDHPNIAKVLDGGETLTGRPYFVMELVKGEPLNKHCDDHKFSVPRRLELFVSVCQAVQHAHQKGLIHRDLKPSNVIVTEYDGQPTAKVIDFGIAKAVDRRATMHTSAGTLVGTPEYMSPEQADSNSVDIDTRSDIYSLGVMLYELLTGETPFARRSAKANIWEVLRFIREEEPTAPSACLASAETVVDVASRRATDSGRLVKQVRGELDWIVLKALEKHRTRRYETAAALADDVRRFLNNEPVEAGPPSKVYRVKKFVRRNRGAVAAATLALLLLVVGIAGTTYGMMRALGAEKAALGEKVTAQEERDAATAVSDFFNGTILRPASAIGQAKSGVEMGPEIKLRTVLDRASKQIEGRFDSQPRVEYAIRHMIGQTYLELNVYDAARHHLERAYELVQHLYADPSPELMAVLTALSQTYEGLDDLERAQTIAQRLVDGRTRLFGPGDQLTLQARSNQADLYRRQGKSETARQLLEELLLDNVAYLGADHNSTFLTQHTLGVVCIETGKYDRAEQVLSAAFEGRRRKLGPTHPGTLVTLNALATLYRSKQDYAKAEPMYRQLAEAREKVLGPDHRQTLTAWANLGQLYFVQDRLDEAEALFQKSLDRRKALFGPTHDDTLDSLAKMASVYQARKQLDNAQPLLEQVYKAQLQKLGPTHPQTLTASFKLATLRLDQKQYAEAESLLRETLNQAQQNRNVNPELRHMTAMAMARCLMKQQKLSDAEPILRESITQMNAAKSQAVILYETQGLLGETLVGLGRFAEAEPLLLAANRELSLRQDKLRPSRRVETIQSTVDCLVRLYEAWGKTDQAAVWRAKLSANSEANSP